MQFYAKKMGTIENALGRQLLQEFKSTNLSGFARTRCPSVTKLRSCSDINQAKDDTLQPE
jgi:hypothetical protein